MGFAVIHIGKGTAGKAGGLGNHIERSVNVPNADPTKEHLNARIDVQNSSNEPKWTKDKHSTGLQQRIDKRIKEGYTPKKKIRNSAVTHLNVVMTGSHEDMDRICENKQLKAWAESNFKFACDRFGKENIVEFSVHMDERTPHIHCVVVPLTKDGRLSAKEVMGNRDKMTDLQEQYGKAMQEFGLDRGIKGSKATHDSIQEYYARVNQAMPLTYETLKEKETIINLTITKQTEEVQRLRKQNAQLKGLVIEKDKQLHPEKYQKKEEPQSLADRVKQIKEESKEQQRKGGMRR